MTLSSTDIEALCYGYDPRVLARWLAELNVWRWPTDCPVPAPDGFNEGSRTEKGVLMQAFLGALEHLVTPEETSRAYWLFILQKPEAEWQEWWDTREAQQTRCRY